jgi:hypothetical protein
MSEQDLLQHLNKMAHEELHYGSLQSDLTESWAFERLGTLCLPDQQEVVRREVARWNQRVTHIVEEPYSEAALCGHRKQDSRLNGCHFFWLIPKTEINPSTSGNSTIPDLCGKCLCVWEKGISQTTV